MSSNFEDEQGRVWEAPRYVQRTCIECHRPFIIADTDMSTFTCGMQDALHKPFIWAASTYAIAERPQEIMGDGTLDVPPGQGPPEVRGEI